MRRLSSDCSAQARPSALPLSHLPPDTCSGGGAQRLPLKKPPFSGSSCHKEVIPQSHLCPRRWLCPLPPLQHFKLVADAMQALSWVAYTGPACGRLACRVEAASGAAQQQLQQQQERTGLVCRRML